MRQIRHLLLPAVLALLSAPVRGAAGARDYMGINQWVDYWDNNTMLSADTPRVADWIRWYTYMEWNSGKAGDFHFAPTLVQPFDFDDWFGKWKKSGLKVSLSVFKPPAYCSSWHSNGNAGKEPSAYPPCGESAGLEPGDYEAFSRWIYELARRYGPGGLGYVDALEIWNEPNLTDKGWGSWRHDSCPKTHGNWCDLCGRQYAALLKASKIRSGQGDARVKVTGGVTADFDQPYFDLLKKEGALEGLEGLNFHCYLGVTDNGSPFGPGAGPGLQPEYQDGFRSFCRKAASWRDQNAPGLKLWLTEFGYDAFDEGKRPHTFIGVTLKEQADYLVRAYVLGAEVLDHMFWFIASDDRDEEAQFQFQNCGLVKKQSVRNPSTGAGQPSARPKPAFWAMALMHAEIGNMEFDSVIRDGRDGVYATVFRSPTPPAKAVIVAWCADAAQKTNSGNKVKGYRLPARVMGCLLTLKTQVPGSDKTIDKVLKPNGDVVELDLTETPCYIEVSCGKP